MQLDLITIQNNLNRARALREQYRTSELYTDQERIRRIESLDKEIQKYDNQLRTIKNIQVQNPEILS
jgi:hypothetical protein